jgi:Cof subfamily protein (haloacid dehalogenase superfamily)
VSGGVIDAPIRPPERTLYVTDLDGTLLDPDKRLSPVSVEILERLIDEGVWITCATARSWITVQRLLGDFRFRLPMVLYNGTFTYDALHDDMLAQHEFDAATVRSIVHACRRHVQPPLVYWLDGNREQVSWVVGVTNGGMDRFWADRPADPRNAPRDTWENLPRNQVFNIVAIGAKEVLESVIEEMGPDARENSTFHVQQDTYHPEDFYLEIAPKLASKAEALRQLTDSLGATRLVVFGDNLNDLSMFSIADESYAVANAAREVLEVATEVIGSNSSDGVARWLDHNAIRDVADTE